MSGCLLIKKSTSNSRIETFGSYEIISQTKLEIGKKGKIQGNIFDKRKGRIIPYGRIWINEDTILAIDSLGSFEVTLSPNSYKFKLWSLGYKEITTDTIRIKENTVTQLNVYLGTSIIFEK